MAFEVPWYGSVSTNWTWYPPLLCHANMVYWVQIMKASFRTVFAVECCRISCWINQSKFILCRPCLALVAANLFLSSFYISALSDAVEKVTWNSDSGVQMLFEVYVMSTSRLQSLLVSSCARRFSDMFMLVKVCSKWRTSVDIFKPFISWASPRQAKVRGWLRLR